MLARLTSALILVLSLATLATATLAPAALAQEGCKPSKLSCSQLNAGCEKTCQNFPNPSACIARSCTVNLTSCKANGVWKSAATASACWKTTNRS